MVTIVQAATQDQMRHARELFREYFEFLHTLLDSTVGDLNNIHSLSGYEAEIAGVLDQYTPPDGRLLLAYDDAELAGCVVICKIGLGRCEVKRLWVRPPFRGKKISRSLVTTLIDEARIAGYRSIVLSSVEAMKEAVALYGSLGFERTASFYEKPEEAMADQIFMKMDLVQ
jgi:putative acetyltransferase